jgi:hypothetical protein
MKTKNNMKTDNIPINYLAEQMKLAFVENLNGNFMDEPFMKCDGKIYTKRQIQKEVSDETKFGISLLKMMMMLSLDIFQKANGKSKMVELTLLN